MVSESMENDDHTRSGIAIRGWKVVAVLYTFRGFAKVTSSLLNYCFLVVSKLIRSCRIILWSVTVDVE